jgi:hypothetical protein
MALIASNSPPGKPPHAQVPPPTRCLSSAPVPAARLTADRDQIATFVDALFRYATPEGCWVSLRSFFHDDARPPADIRAVALAKGLPGLVAAATARATYVANLGEPTVFAPPICTFKAPKPASEENLAEGLAISVECDEHPTVARQLLTGLLGLPTLVIASGGSWTDPDTGELQDKLHAHWRLREPTRDPDEHQRLKRARRIAALLAGSDKTATPMVHPLRWPGSWHLKGAPRLATIIDINPDAEIDLDDALHELETASVLRELNADERPPGNGADTAIAPDEDLEALAATIGNPDLPWARWNTIGMAFHGASGGSDAGLAAFDRWSGKSSKHEPGATAARWENYQRSPATRMDSMAKLVALAQEIDSTFRRPSLDRPSVKEPPDWVIENLPPPDTPNGTADQDPPPHPGDGAQTSTTKDHRPNDDQRPWPAPMRPEAFHGPAGDFVRLVAPQTESDPAAILMQFLVAFGNAAGRGLHVLVEEDEHYGNEFLVQVGTTSRGRKGTSWGRVRKLFKLAAEMWSATRVTDGLSTGEGLISAVRDRRMGVDKDGEEVVEDAGVADKRLLVVQGEFASVLRMGARDGNSLSTTMRCLWDSGDIGVLTKSNPMRATGAHVSIIGHITGEEFRAELTRTDSCNGFANRLLITCCRRSQRLPFGGQQVDLGPLAGTIADRLAWAAAQGHRRILWTDAARELWIPTYDRLGEERGGLLGAITSRAEAHCLRLALIYAMLDRSAYIERHHLEAALAVWDHCDASATYVFGDAIGDPTADEILRALRSARPNGLTRLDLNNLFSRHRTAAEIGRALGVLLNLRKARMDRTRTAGRPVETWFAT